MKVFNLDDSKKKETKPIAVIKLFVLCLVLIGVFLALDYFAFVAVFIAGWILGARISHLHMQEKLKNLMGVTETMSKILSLSSTGDDDDLDVFDKMFGSKK